MESRVPGNYHEGMEATGVPRKSSPRRRITRAAEGQLGWSRDLAAPHLRQRRHPARSAPAATLPERSI